MGDVHHVHNYYMRNDSDDDAVEIVDNGPAFPVQRAVLAIIIVLIIYFGYGYAKQKGLLETVPATNGRLVIESNLIEPSPQPKKKVKLRATISDLQHQNAEIEKERQKFYESRSRTNE